MLTDTAPTPSKNTKETSMTWLTLFTTTGTLVCCALPIALVNVQFKISSYLVGQIDTAMSEDDFDL